MNPTTTVVPNPGSQRFVQSVRQNRASIGLVLCATLLFSVVSTLYRAEMLPSLTKCNTLVTPIAPRPRSIYSVQDICIGYTATANISKPQTSMTEKSKRLFNKAQSCLRNSPYAPKESKPILCDKEYVPPVDIQAHFEEIMEYVNPWWSSMKDPDYVGFYGPWIETRWYNDFNRDVNVVRDFGGLVPLFVPWHRMEVHFLPVETYWDTHEANKLFSMLRDDVLYVTVAQKASGITPFTRRKQYPPDMFWNILVLSSGGYGHIPLPLLASEVPMQSFPLEQGTYQYLYSFYGTMHESFSGTRVAMAQVVKSKTKGYPYAIGSGSNWLEVMNNTLLNLAPRGFGKTSFRLYEIIQLGRGVPIYLWDDDEWIPYRDTEADLRRFGFSMHADQFETFTQTLVSGLRRNPWYFNLQQRQQTMRELREFYTFKGVMKQIEYFFKGSPKSLLRCEQHPVYPIA